MKGATLFSGFEGVGTGMKAAGIEHAWGLSANSNCAKIEPVTTVFAGLFLWPVREPYNRKVGLKAPVFSAYPGTVVTDVQASLRVREFCVMGNVPDDIIIDIKKIRVRVGPANKQHYYDKGYDVWGKNYAVVRVEDMPESSGVKVPIVCPRCDKRREATIQKVNRTGHTYCKACVKHINNFQDITGQRFRRLVAVEAVGQDSAGATQWLCICDCGEETITAITRLNNGLTNSCGCLRIERTIEAVSGENNVNYNPDLTERDRIDRRIIPKYCEWRDAIKERDNYTCRACGVRGSSHMAAHHLNAWFSFPEQRFDLNNGVTLCSGCHNEFHAIYGRGHNTKGQYIEWLGVRQ